MLMDHQRTNRTGVKMCNTTHNITQMSNTALRATGDTKKKQRACNKSDFCFKLTRFLIYLNEPFKYNIKN